MKKMIMLLITLFTVSITFPAIAEIEINPKEYRNEVDKEIAKLGYTQLRSKLSKIIHEMKEPWELSYYKTCIEKKKENPTYREKCEKFLTESINDRYQRLELIVDGIVLELNNSQDKYGRKWFWSLDDLALATLVKMHNESGHFELDVHTGKTLGDHGHSFCLAMVWSRSKDKYFRHEMTGYDQTKLNWSLQKMRACSYMSMYHLTYHQRRCIAGEKIPTKIDKNYNKYKISAYLVSKIYSGYATGYFCEPGFPGKTIKNGSIIYEPHWEPLRRANQFWKLRSSL